jgi:uncharacterized protein (DUF924 family)
MIYSGSETRTSFGNNWRHQMESWCALSIVLIQLKELIFQNFNDLSSDPETRTSFGNNWRHQMEYWCALSIVLIQLKELIF